MSQTNEPPLDLESWNIKVKLNDGTEFILRPEDMPKNLKNNLIEVINVYFYIHVDHLKSKYSEEIYGQREQEELNESYKQSLANKKERETDDSSEN